MDGAPSASRDRSCGGIVRAWPTRALLALLALVVGLRWYRSNRALPAAFARCDHIFPVLVGTHHKTGTVLLQHILKEVCPLLGWRCTFNDVPTRCPSPEAARAAGLHLCFNQHGVRFKLASGAPHRFIHAVRDPLEAVLSGYQYHLKTTERWARRVDKRYNGTSYREYLNSLPLREGLRAEVKHAMRDSLKTMPRLTNRTAGTTAHLSPLLASCLLPSSLHRHPPTSPTRAAPLFRSQSVSSHASSGGLLCRLGGDYRPAHNVYAKNKPLRYNRHVSNASSARDQLRRMLRDMPDVYKQLQKVRRRINYPLVGREGAL
ncbi:hypothetical protein AB1Y20_001837 [Prymnesium parvum]|uniref:Protein-tyrosine sulfotransferase n=1 Tax=Prymnesium parvum TaxID=97485 RepID=A0AB34K9F1_PRYPA